MKRATKIGTNLGEAFLKAYALKQFPHGVQEVQSTQIKQRREKPVAKPRPKIVLNEYERDALVRVYESGGDRMRHLGYDTREKFYQLGLLSNHRRLCAIWGIYTLTPKGVDLASDLADF